MVLAPPPAVVILEFALIPAAVLILRQPETVAGRSTVNAEDAVAGEEIKHGRQA